MVTTLCSYMREDHHLAGSISRVYRKGHDIRGIYRDGVLYLAVVIVLYHIHMPLVLFSQPTMVMVAIKGLTE